MALLPTLRHRRQKAPFHKPNPSSSSSSMKDTPVSPDQTNSEDKSTSAPSLDSLPSEIHLLISSNLTYPDALSLKHTSRHFYHLVDTGVELKVIWLMERRRLHLECPNNTRCDLGSDLRFCRGSVSLLMQRRREHIECESRPGLGCLVYGTRSCSHRTLLSRCKAHLRRGVTVELWWLLLALIPPLLCWLLWAFCPGAGVVLDFFTFTSLPFPFLASLTPATSTSSGESVAAAAAAAAASSVTGDARGVAAEACAGIFCLL